MIFEISEALNFYKTTSSRLCKDHPIKKKNKYTEHCSFIIKKKKSRFLVDDGNVDMQFD